MDAQRRRSSSRALPSWRVKARAALRPWLTLVALIAFALFSSSSAARAEVELPRPDPNDPIVVTAERSTKWSQGGYDVWVLQRCSITQGYTVARGDEAVLWIKAEVDPTTSRNFVIAYLEGSAQVNFTRAGYPFEMRDSQWLGEFFSKQPIQMRVPTPSPEPQNKPPIFTRGQAKRDPQTAGAVRRTQFAPGELPPPTAPVAATNGTRRLRAFPRSSVKVQAQWFPDPNDPESRVAVITSGVNLIVDGLPNFGSIDILTDRIVLWTRGTDADLTGSTGTSNEVPLQIYMEGNIVFRQGDRVVHAERMFYDVQRQTATILNADVLTPLPGFQGLARLQANMIQQQGPDVFSARDAFVTTSRLGAPRYRLQSAEMIFEDRQTPDINFSTGQPNLNPITGEPQKIHQQQVTAKQNFVYLGPVPIGYWPVFSADLNEPAYFLRGVRVKNDSIMGTQVYTDFDMYQLLGIKQRPEGTDWIVEADYLSKRGFAAGTVFDYNRDEFLGLDGRANGFADFWGISDRGLDQLGGDLFNLPPEESYRYRAWGRHRQQLGNGWQLTGEYAKISDRNFLDQYFRRDWDQEKDAITGLQLKNIWENQSLALSADVRLNNFFTQTERLPRLDHYLIGQPLLGEWLTWSEHTFGSYERLRVRSDPTNATQLAEQQLLPWESSVKGERFTTRHELDLPLQLGVVKVVPYVMGEFAHYGQDITGNDMNRLYGQAGVRSSLPFWNVDPDIESDLLNVHGLAHKVVLEGEFFAADANRDYTQLPLYDQLDDDSQEYFRRQAMQTTFGGATPLMFDDRNYALRSGLGTWLTSPTTEVSDDLMAFKLNARQRWQTKRGRPDQRHVVDWITLDFGTMLFPNPTRDNFGQIAGITQYDFRWHIGDRLTMLSEGQYDYFADGLKYTTVGMNLTRPPRIGFYAGFSSISGPVNVNTFTSIASYRLSPKWIASTMYLVDLKNFTSIGNNVALTRVGESFLASFNFNYDRYRDNVGVNFTLEPRFLKRTKYGAVAGVPTPMAGLYGLE